VLRARNILGMASYLVLGGCSVSGEDAANQWVQSRTPMVAAFDASIVPALLDTPPAVFNAKDVVNPFMPARIGQALVSEKDVLPESGGQWQFADSPIDALRVVGFLEVKGHYIGMIEGSAGSINVKVGDRLGNQQAEIVDISKQGIRLRQMDDSESWMPIGRRSLKK
jgi:Tfp pilus assembly protein PilP